MVERIWGWAFTRVVKGVSERSGLIPGLVYARVGLFTTLKIFSIG